MFSIFVINTGGICTFQYNNAAMAMFQYSVMVNLKSKVSLNVFTSHI